MSGFKAPEPVWLAPDPYNRAGSRRWGLRIAVVTLCILAGFGFAKLKSSDSQGDSAESPQSAAEASTSIGACFNNRYSDGSELESGTGVVVGCDAPDARYSLVATGEEDPNCTEVPEPSLTLQYRSESDELLCLERIVIGAECFPISTPSLEAESHMSLEVSVPCEHGELDDKFAGVGIFLGFALPEESCPFDAYWRFSLDSDPRQLCLA